MRNYAEAGEIGNTSARSGMLHVRLGNAAGTGN
jgi:hypothetical protein